MLYQLYLNNTSPAIKREMIEIFSAIVFQILAVNGIDFQSIDHESVRIYSSYVGVIMNLIFDHLNG